MDNVLSMIRTSLCHGSFCVKPHLSTDACDRNVLISSEFSMFSPNLLRVRSPGVRDSKSKEDFVFTRTLKRIM